MIKLDSTTKQMMYNYFQTLTLDKIELSEYLYQQSHNDRLHNLVLAWTSCEGNDLEYIWDHINNQSEIYLPILVCPDDVDFWCTVLVAKIKYTQDTVIWERLAFVEGSYDIEAWRTSGLQNLKLWSDEDFINYDEDRQKILNNEMTWNQFSSKHWNVDERLRLDRYIHKYFNDENNLDFLEIEALIFDKDNYLSVINKLKKPVE